MPRRQAAPAPLWPLLGCALGMTCVVMLRVVLAPPPCVEPEESFTTYHYRDDDDLLLDDDESKFFSPPPGTYDANAAASEVNTPTDAEDGDGAAEVPQDFLF